MSSRSVVELERQKVDEYDVLRDELEIFHGKALGDENSIPVSGRLRKVVP